ncbi:hypothetical protein Vretifemale_17234 [Volvox reticuliferus]|uniref:Uncharacterized protein n=1 Tax=Volvox reticuliferus TaxID=1737510 RepID=A0A8J4CTC2_9CHLO|nr:hypothetical protein Vretifemale_17234 [Volvox reticuliferus]
MFAPCAVRLNDPMNPLPQDSAPTGLVNRAMLLLYVLMMAAAYYDGDNDSAKDLANSQRHSAILLTSALMSYHGMPPWPYPELLELATLLSNLKVGDDTERHALSGLALTSADRTHHQNKPRRV